CIRHEIGSCLGPCIAACSRHDYEQRVQAVCKFLDGHDASLLTALERDMTHAAAKLEFERAAVLREKLQALDWLHRHLERVRQASRQYHFIYPVKGHGGQDLWYLIRHGWVAAALPTPRDASSRNQAAEAIEAVFHQGPSWGAPAQPEEMDGVFLVSAWFR